MKPVILVPLMLAAAAGCSPANVSQANMSAVEKGRDESVKHAGASMGGAVSDDPGSPTRPPGAAPDRTEAIPQRVWDAFEAATGHRSNFGVIEGGETVVTRPVKIVELPFGPALLTEVEIEQGCHGCVGAIGIYYLNEAGGKFRVRKAWPRAIKGWTWGLPPTDWHLTDRFTSYPAIYATGGFLAQGISLGGATITELRPTGPIGSDPIGTGFDDQGDPETGRRPCRVEGRIANIRKDQSFDLVVSGSVKAVAHYAKRDGRFKTRSRIQWNDPCRG